MLEKQKALLADEVELLPEPMLLLDFCLPLSSMGAALAPDLNCLPNPLLAEGPTTFRITISPQLGSQVRTALNASMRKALGAEALTMRSDRCLHCSIFRATGSSLRSPVWPVWDDDIMGRCLNALSIAKKQATL